MRDFSATRCTRAVRQAARKRFCDPTPARLPAELRSDGPAGETQRTGKLRARCAS